MIQTYYLVHNPHMTTNSVQAVVGGEPMAATVEVFEVELIAEDLADGGIKLRFLGADIAGAKDLFIADSKILVQFAKLSETAEAAPAAA